MKMINIRNIATNFAGSAIPILLIILTVPAYLNTIGPDKYGILSIVWIVFGYFGIFDFGISRAVTNAVSRAPDHKEGRRAIIVWSASALNLVIGIIVGLIAGAVAFIFSMCVHDKVFTSVLPSLPFMMAGIPVLTVTGCLIGALDGARKFRISNTIQVFGSTLYQCLPVLFATYFSKNVSFLIDVIICCRFVVLVTAVIYNYRTFGMPSKNKISKIEILNLLKFGSGVAIINIIDPLFSRFDQIVVANISGVSSVAAYNVSANSINRINILPMAISRALFPSLSSTNLEDARDQLFRLKNTLMISWFFVCLFAITSSSTIFSIWLHNNIAASVARISKFLIVAIWACCLAYLPYTALQANGNSNKIIKAHLVELPFYLFSLFVMAKYLGPVGAALANCGRMLADYLLLWAMCGYPIGKQRLFICLFVILLSFAFIMP